MTGPYFRGHQWGVIEILVGSLSQAFCLPLDARLHQGFAHLRQKESPGAVQETLCRRLLAMALQFAHHQDTPAWLVLDAFFATGPVFTLAASCWSVALKQPYLHVLTRAKKNYVAYQEPEPLPRQTRGRPRKYGAKVSLSEVFETHHAQFCTATTQVYDRVETISYLALNLLWKPCHSPLRFVFAITSRGPIVLMCSDLSLDPLTALALYCARVRVETMFAMLKGVIGAFRYRFWSKRLPRHSRRPKKNALLKPPAVHDLPTVQRTWQACEGFVLLGCLTLGLLQLVALKFSGHIWDAFPLFLRTRSRSLPSEQTVKTVLTQARQHDFLSLTPSATLQLIRSALSRPGACRNPPP